MSALKIGSLFSGVGGLDMAVEAFFAGETVWHCEFDEEPSKVLAARWPGVPNFGDVTAVKWTPDCPACGQSTALYFRDEAEEGRAYYCPSDGWFSLSIRFDDPDADRIPEPVDILCGGFPCQDLSLAGRRSGMRPGTRSGLWADFVKAIDALRPKVVVIENVRGLLSGCAESTSDSTLGLCPRCVDPDGGASHSPNVRALGRVLGDLSALGFDAEWHGLLASDIGAPHGRFRVFVLAYARGVRLDERWGAVTGEAQSGRESAVSGGRSGTPVGLFPTPSASNANDGEGADTWLARRERVKATGINGNGMGMPLAIAVQLLPTPTVRDEAASGGSNESNVTLTDAIVRTDLGRKANHRHLMPTPVTQPETGNGHARNLGKEVKMLPTPRASRGASGTETMYALGAERDDAGDRQGNVVGELSWGEYEPAVRMWESITRPAPAPTLPDGKNGNHRLAAVFPEWMMGYPLGWVTDILGRNPAIKACGNGVVPQQAYAALEVMWPRMAWELAA
ncbi:DNA cytosine methyltransferase [Microbacterium arabinogalactanolyticum]|uniref:DNA cytosine methyltransferase n=1 Tax=Microbacterium arabinogalactanolyticum TaxID=69365 RepID=UPI004043B382